MDSGTKLWLEDVKFLDEKHGVVIGDKGLILRTEDGGQTWEKVKTNLRENLYALSFFDAQNGYAVGANGTIVSTVDGGATWQDQESNLQINLYAVSAYRKNEAIAVGEQGAVLRTEDGGRTWESQPNITSNSLQAVVYRGGMSLWIAGRGGSILKRTETLETVKTSQGAKLPPILRSKPKIKPRTPLITITDDGDIPPAAAPTKKPEN
jgi:photosystem II stability/assembly factor-like uncharacterized protein